MSQAGTEELNPPRRHWLRWFFILAGAAVVVVGALLVCLWAMTTNLLDRHIAAIRARGEPATFADLAATIPPLPPEEDTTELWLQAAKELRIAVATPISRRLDLFASGAQAPPAGQPWAEAAPVRQFLADYDAALQAVRTAAARGGKLRFRFPEPTDSCYAFSAAVSEKTTDLRLCNQMLLLEAQTCAYERDSAGVAAALDAAILLVGGLDSNAGFDIQFMRAGIFQNAANDLQRHLFTASFTADELTTLQRTLEAIDFHSIIKPLLFNERAYCIWAIRVAGDATLQEAVAERLRVGNATTTYFQTMADLIAVADAPWSKIIDVTGPPQPNAQKLHPFPGKSYILSWIEVVPTVIRQLARCELKRQELIAILATERFRRAEGHPPARLDELVPRYLSTIPTDPGTGAPLSYDKTERGYAIYTSSLKLQSGPNEQPEQQYGALPAFLFVWSPDGPPAEVTPAATELEPPPDETAPAEAATQ